MSKPKEIDEQLTSNLSEVVTQQQKIITAIDDRSENKN